MTNRNTMSKGRFLLSHAIWWPISLFLFRYFVFIPLEGRTEADSFELLRSAVAFAVCAGIFLTFKRRRNYLSVAINVLLPYEIYTLIACWNDFNVLIPIICFTALFFSVWFVISVIFRDIQQDENAAAVIRKRVAHAFLGARTIAVICLCALIVSLGICAFAENAPNSMQSQRGAEEWSVTNKMEDLAKLEPKVWEKLDPQERLEVLSVLKNVDLQRMGVFYEVSLCAEELEETLNGVYMPGEKRIVIDAEHLQNSPAEEVARTLLHECHHVYTCLQVELYQQIPEEYKRMLMFSDVQTYENEYAHYVSSNEDYEAYAAQFCEISADCHAEEAAAIYYNMIWDYENKEMEK